MTGGASLRDGWRRVPPPSACLPGWDRLRNFASVSFKWAMRSGVGAYLGAHCSTRTMKSSIGAPCSVKWECCQGTSHWLDASPRSGFFVGRDDPEGRPRCLPESVREAALHCAASGPLADRERYVPPSLEAAAGVPRSAGAFLLGRLRAHEKSPHRAGLGMWS